jgi:hypothetical protein
MTPKRDNKTWPAIEEEIATKSRTKQIGSKIANRQQGNKPKKASQKTPKDSLQVGRSRRAKQAQMTTLL